MAQHQSTWWRQGFAFLHAVWKCFTADRGPLSAAAIAFFLLLSLFPLLLLLLSVIAFFFTPEEAARQVTRLTINLGPSVGAALREQVVSVVINRGLLTGIALVGGFWSGSQVFITMQLALNGIWRATRVRPFWLNYGLAFLMTLILGALIVLALLLSAVAPVIWESIFPHEVYPLLSRFVKFLVTFLAPMLLVSIVLVITYWLLPTRKMPWRPIVVTSLVTAIFWEIALQLFSLYAANFGRYSSLYGSLGGLVLLMLWLDYSAIIMLLGAEAINIWVDHGAQDCP